MSSHHIVKDDQEPAILIDHLSSFSQPIILSILEWSPIVIATDNSYEQLLSLDIKIDVIFYEKNEEAILENMRHQNEYFQLEQVHGSLLESVLKWLNKKDHFALNYFTSSLLIDDYKFWETQSFIKTLVVFDNKYRWILNKNSPYQKWLPKGVTIATNGSIIQHQNLEQRSINNYEVINDGTVNIEHQSALFIGESMDFDHLF